MKELQHIKFIYLTPENLNEQEINCIHIARKYYEIIIHWVYKLDWKSNHKMPYDWRICNPIKPVGEFYYRIFKLCEGVHARQSKIYETVPYSDATVWFKEIILEFFQACIEEMITKCRVPFNEKIHNGEIKRYLMSILNKQVSTLKSMENPYIEDNRYPHYNRLLNMAIEMSNESIKFKNEYYTPFIKSARAMVENFKTPAWQRTIYHSVILSIYTYQYLNKFF
jgi:hypothetical protein